MEPCDRGGVGALGTVGVVGTVDAMGAMGPWGLRGGAWSWRKMVIGADFALCN